MADTDTLIGVLEDHLIYLLQKNDRWFGRCETWSKAGGGYSFRGPSADTPNKASAQEYAVREFLGLDQEAAKKRNKEIDWRPSAQIIVVRRIPEGRSLKGKSCVRQGCRDPLEYVVEFASAEAIPRMARVIMISISVNPL